MKRKSNPWVALIALLLLAVLIVCICTGCADATDAAEISGDRFRVEAIQRENVSGAPMQIYVLTDTETGVRYLYVKRANSGGLTKLEEAPGEEADR